MDRMVTLETAVQTGGRVRVEELAVMGIWGSGVQASWGAGHACWWGAQPLLLFWLCLPLQLGVRNEVSEPLFTSLSLSILSFPCFLPLTSFPLPSRAACHCHMPGSSVSGPPAPLGHKRKLMPVVSPEPAAISLGATVAPDLLSANNPRPGKAKDALGSMAPVQACGSR